METRSSDFPATNDIELESSGRKLTSQFYSSLRILSVALRVSHIVARANERRLYSQASFIADATTVNLFVYVLVKLVLVSLRFNIHRVYSIYILGLILRSARFSIPGFALYRPLMKLSQRCKIE